jgi:hypothetical protein
MRTLLSELPVSPTSYIWQHMFGSNSYSKSWHVQQAPSFSSLPPRPPFSLPLSLKLDQLIDFPCSTPFSTIDLLSSRERLTSDYQYDAYY